MARGTTTIIIGIIIIIVDKLIMRAIIARAQQAGCLLCFFVASFMPTQTTAHPQIVRTTDDTIDGILGNPW
jgi:ABC-type sugar transport system substrate-binding protein